MKNTINEGDKFNHLTFLRRDGYRNNGKNAFGIFRCDCGNEKSISINHVKDGNTKCCGKGCKTKKEKYLGKDTKSCNKCKQEFEISTDFFHKRKTSPDGFNTICKSCCKIGKKREIEHWSGNNLWCLGCREYKSQDEFYRNPEAVHRNCKNGRCKICVEKARKKRQNYRRDNGDSLSILILERFCGLRDRAKKNGLTLDFTKDYLKELWNKQDGLCAISGIKMTHQAYSGRVYTNLSVDRIDSNKGYIKDNVQLVCMAVNQMKSDLTIEELVYFCKEIIKNYEN